MKLLLLLAAACLMLAGCDATPTTTDKVAKVCKYTDEVSCNADTACAWDKYGGADNTGKCKTLDKAPQGDKAKAKEAGE